MKSRSLQSRLVAGVVIWSAAVLAAAFVVGLIAAVHYPRQVLLIHNGVLALTGAVIVTAGVTVIRRGLSPFGLLRERLAAVRQGTSARLDGEYPNEVTPLVDDLNGLLDERDRRVARAVAKAGDLAHGLKTPLAVLSQDIERIAESGQADLAESMRRQVARMRRQIDSHLAQARATAAGASTTARAMVTQAADAIARTAGRLYADRALTMVVTVPADLAVRVPLEDLEEMLGNLVDNGCKWARSRVAISAARDGNTLTIVVDDDGPGLAAAERTRVLERGARGDETMPGSGLGLAIVQDLATTYGGSVRLDASPEGGVRARLTLPVAPTK